MIVLDTNVLSEFMRRNPAESVLTWFSEQPGPSLFTTAINEAEIRYGVAILPDGKKKQGLLEAIDGMFAEDFAGRILRFDSAAAKEYANIGRDRREHGQPISQFDAQIAAVARSRGATLATRNTKDFQGCGVTLSNPWAAI